MGHFYSNFTVRGPSARDVAAALAGRRTFISPVHHGCIVIYDEASEDQDFETITELGMLLSLKLRCPVLAAVVHDDDVLVLQLYERGTVTDSYDSSPGYFDADAEPSDPEGGDASLLCAAFGSTKLEEVAAILRKSTYEDDGPDATDRHAEFVRALGLPAWSVGAGFGSIAEGELPDGLAEAQLVTTE